MNPKKNQTSLRLTDPSGGEDQETQTPSHGYNAAYQEGDYAADKEDTNGNGSKANNDSNWLKRLRQVMDSNELLPSQKVILAVIISETNDEFICELTYEEIAARASLSRRNVATHIPLLEKAGWIERSENLNSYVYKYLK